MANVMIEIVFYLLVCVHEINLTWFKWDTQLKFYGAIFGVKNYNATAKWHCSWIVIWNHIMLWLPSKCSLPWWEPGCLCSLMVVCWPTYHYHLGTNFGLGISEKVFHFWLRFFTFGGRSAHLAYHMHKNSHKTPIITMIRTTCSIKIVFKQQCVNNIIAVIIYVEDVKI